MGGLLPNRPGLEWGPQRPKKRKYPTFFWGGEGGGLLLTAQPVWLTHGQQVVGRWKSSRPPAGRHTGFSVALRLKTRGNHGFCRKPTCCMVLWALMEEGRNLTERPPALCNVLLNRDAAVLDYRVAKNPQVSRCPQDGAGVLLVSKQGVLINFLH